MVATGWLFKFLIHFEIDSGKKHPKRMQKTCKIECKKMQTKRKNKYFGISSVWLAKSHIVQAQTSPLNLVLFKEDSEASSFTKAVLTGFGCNSPVSFACNKPFTRSWHCKIDMSFCKGKATTLFTKVLFSKTGPSEPLILQRFFLQRVFSKGFFSRIDCYLWLQSETTGSKKYHLRKWLHVYIYIYLIPICIYLDYRTCIYIFLIPCIYLKLCSMESAKLCHQNGCRTWYMHAFSQGTYTRWRLENYRFKINEKINKK